jgi:hypothetical protein
LVNVGGVAAELEMFAITTAEAMLSRSAERVIDPTFRLKNDSRVPIVGGPSLAEARRAKADIITGTFGRETGIIARRALRDSALEALRVSAR